MFFFLRPFRRSRVGVLELRYVYPEMGIYRDNLSVIVIGDDFLPIIVIAQNSFDLSITDIADVIYLGIADKLSR